MKPAAVDPAAFDFAKQEFVDVSSEACALAWAMHFGVSVEDLRVAHEAVGPMPAAVRFYLVSNARVGRGRIKARPQVRGAGRPNPRTSGRYVTSPEERSDAEQATAIVPCPFCFSALVDRQYLRSGGCYWPGCLTCKQSRSMHEWTHRVRQLRASA